ncbi:hypothetical protein GF348_10015 [candidate division KSB3 bacterium]|nr:hypothetical protein [candidate division KSB3 bacterium]
MSKKSQEIKPIPTREVKNQRDLGTRGYYINLAVLKNIAEDVSQKMPSVRLWNIEQVIFAMIDRGYARTDLEKGGDTDAVTPQPVRHMLEQAYASGYEAGHHDTVEFKEDR